MRRVTYHPRPKQSTGTLGKRLELELGLANTEANRVAFRELFYTARLRENGISGAIMVKVMSSIQRNQRVNQRVSRPRRV